MSSTMQGVDARAYLSGWLDNVTLMTIKDVKAIPDDKWNESMGGCTRPANALMADTITNLLWTAETIKGTSSQAYLQMEQVAEECKDKQAAIERFLSASAELSQAIKTASDEALNKEVMAPWQMPAPMMTMAQIAVAHVWYHDGQFNYIHCLLGDDKVHWMEP